MTDQTQPELTGRLTDDEAKVLDMLGAAFGMFYKLQTIHPSDLQEFQLAIHSAQNIILSRPAMRQYQIDNGFSYMMKVNGL